ncbi:MAG: DUF1269 domain-containing protein [Rubritepida sp.]|nr:DUF1269 domain-containing protein [Rubritepida sp.]
MPDTTIAVFTEHSAAEAAIRKLAGAGFPMANLSIVGQGYHTEEKVIGFYGTADRVRFWGRQGAFWGGMWGLFTAGMFLTIPVVGSLVVLGGFAATLLIAIENALVIGGLSALGAALYSMGVPRDSVVAYEAAVKADGFLVMAHGTEEEMVRAHAILGTADARELAMHPGVIALPAEPAVA